MTAHVTFIPSHIPFLETLAQFLLARFSPVEIAQTVLLLPTHRSCLKFEEILRGLSPRETVLLPKLIPLGGLEEEQIFMEGSLPLQQDLMGLLPVASFEERLMLLTEEIQSFYVVQKKNLKTSQACALAKHLLHLIDQIQLEGLDFSCLADLVPEEYALHWQVTVQFLDIIGKAWPQRIKAIGKMEPKEHQRLLLEYYARLWQENIPDYPVIAAGSTGSIPATAALLNVISKLPTGLVILPGLHPTLKTQPSATHPQHTMYRLLETLEIETEEIVPLMDFPKQASDRFLFLTNMFESASLSLSREDVQKSLQSFMLVECSHQQEEASVIAFAIREALEDSHKTVTFITPDRTLTKRVIQELDLWKIRANDSAGTPFSETPLGIFLNLTAQWIQKNMTSLTLLGTLKHPHACSFKHFAQTLEQQFLRKGSPFGSLIDYSKEGEKFEETYKIVKALMEEGQALAIQEDVSFQKCWSFQRKILCTLAQTETLDLGTSEEKKIFEGFIKALDQYSEVLRLTQGDDYGALFQQFLSSFTVRKTYALHPRLSILGPIEARLMSSDFMILGGMNEGSWPSLPSIDPWFNQSMRQKFGLPGHDRRVGLAALDFVHACSAQNVLLTRSRRLQGNPTVPSRFLKRIEASLNRLGLSLASGDKLLKVVRAFYKPSTQKILLPPQPSPPVEVRPRQVSITDITTLMHDPYSFYAKKILRLKPLYSLDKVPGVLEFGLFVHDVLEHLFEELPTFEKGRTWGEKKFRHYFQEEPCHSLWWYRFENILRWVIKITQVHSSPQFQWREIQGKLVFPFVTDFITLIGKADRVEAREGGIIIIDYKTGTPPTFREMETGLAPQMPLEALIAREGGFGDLSSKQVVSLSFWHLSGHEEGGEIIAYQERLEDLLTTTRQGFQKLIETFYTKRTPYLSVPYELSSYREYHHLARIKEWSLNGERSA